jgi:hypothetical protein
MVWEDAGPHGAGTTLEVCVRHFLNLCIFNVYQSSFQYAFWYIEFFVGLQVHNGDASKMLNETIAWIQAIAHGLYI